MMRAPGEAIDDLQQRGPRTLAHIGIVLDDRNLLVGQMGGDDGELWGLPPIAAHRIGRLGAAIAVGTGIEH